jgi:hypothetical protein
MKISSVLAAVAAVALAPLAVAQTPANCANQANTAILNGLTITSTIKRTTVTGGNRIVQTIIVRNNGAAAAAGLVLGTAFDPAAATLLKGSARIAKGSKLTLTPRAAPNNGVLTTGATAFSIPAGKTLKATVSWKTINCPPAAPQNTFSWGPVGVGIPADTNRPDFPGIGCLLISTPNPTATVG